ncbi:MAG: hypothetical protein EAX96_20240 [Candidatus Lokiarchaeota archaeon]|nr:hypothetical protein [Candidatus Lokiarchaeota archaeon]
MSKLAEKISISLFDGTLGYIFPRGKTRIKIMDIGNFSIAFRDGKEGIIILFEISDKSLEIRYLGKRFKEVGQKIRILVKNEVKKIKFGKFN